ncbi:MAG: ABC transporter substrate-binding protein [Rhodospirillaceae bacterium]|jgi:peptide/nickel transport system substrate-binding protein|nr:ABC transporter substrate-binding protein [Rhodospirillales bacterium]MBT3906688.1 ABC transporter substrate-binding protein [Rhodospirillaceae bacterium]MBT4700482.1 ABC transporter substrate-binding protein [Rhodospirillaceae bacterium]MBT5033450.1 ABC transporter substrate-binding protein [Rhodospirillaceae bacterium]MBT6221355.1 ABC transporter substrate-binding protein [Rhodospirillaceae bacterium]
MNTILKQLALSAVIIAAASVPVAANTYIETPTLAHKVAAGDLPPVAKRLPETPSVVRLEKSGESYGKHGGRMRILMSRAKDIRMMVVYGYARLVGYNKNFIIEPDILEKVDVEEGRIFTLHIRKGHKWSDGHPFTSEDFRFFWEDVAKHRKLSKSGPNRIFKIGGKLPKFEVLDAETVRYTWQAPNPFFLPALAKARPVFIYRPAHYLKQFHIRYVRKKKLKRMAKKAKKRNWRSLFKSKARLYRNTNPELPSLQPWFITNKMPAERFIFVRNPYFHRVDKMGRQLPYIDQVIVGIANKKLIPAKSGAGETDLQARSLFFNNYTFLKQGEKRNNFKVQLWSSAKGSQMALFPNLNAADPAWRDLLRKADFRRALSLGIDRHEINQVIYFGLARESNNTILPESKLYKESYSKKYATFDLKKANKLLDGLGLTKRNSNNIRLMKDGRPLDIIVETAGEETEQTDVLELIQDSWRKIGVKLYTKPLQREVFRRRVIAGSSIMSVWFGLENGVPTSSSSPEELAPTRQLQLQWPKWGQHFNTSGKAGELPQIKEVKELSALNKEWRLSASPQRREEIWHRMLALHADNVFSIGLIASVPQPVVVNGNLRNVSPKGIYNWDPGAHFGVHRPDTFWFDTSKSKKRK